MPVKIEWLSIKKIRFWENINRLKSGYKLKLYKGVNYTGFEVGIWYIKLAGLI